MMRVALALLAALHALAGQAAAWQMCDITKHGAKGDNSTSDTAAIKQAIAACAGGGDVVLPAPGKYLTGPLNLTSNIRLVVPSGAMLLASQTVADYPAVDSFPSYLGSRDIANSTCRYGAVVGAVGATNVTVTGGGVIDGQGWHFWALRDTVETNPDSGALKCSRPHLVEFEHCTNVAITGASTDEPLTLQNSPFWTSHFIYSKGCRASDLRILAPATRGNTDGVNPDSTTDVVIENLFISNGDDGVAIKSGLNEAGIKMGLPSSNITVRNITTHGRVSGGVKDVRIEDVKLLGQRGVHMKTTRGRGGYIENISMSNVTAPAGIQLWSTYGSTEPTGAWPYVGNITITSTGPKTSCRLSCGKLPAKYCDASTFYVARGACHSHLRPL